MLSPVSYYQLNEPTYSVSVKTLSIVSLSIVYFFFNSTFLPHGLLWTTVLSPLLYLWLLSVGQKWVLLKYFSIFGPLLIFQILLSSVADPISLARSFVLCILIYLTVYAFSVFCFRSKEHAVQQIFNILILLNFVFCSFAVVTHQVGLFDSLWSEELRPRLRLLVYEPSYYGTLMVPLVAFTLFRVYLRSSFQRICVFLLSIVPFVVCMSVGTTVGLICALGFVVLLNLKHFLFRKSTLFLFVLLLLVIVLSLQFDNIITFRLLGFLRGEDSSGSVRTTQSYLVAYQIAEKTSFLFGSGFGQSKVHAAEFFDEWWKGLDFSELGNVVAGTFAEHGLYGLILRFSLELYLYFKMKVGSDYYRSTLFWFAFLYQFTGSYLTNVAEYVIWTLAFVPVFSQFTTENMDRLRQWRRRKSAPYSGPDILDSNLRYTPA